MDNQLPNEFDIIIVGTGIIESILSAAASRVGKRVLHIDRNNYYGGHWASFNLDAVSKLQHNKAPVVTTQNINALLNDGEESINVGNNSFDTKDFTCSWHIAEGNVNEKKSKEEHQEKAKVENLETSNEDIDPTNEPTGNEWTRENLHKDSRKFNIDLVPKLQYARGMLVELLISSNIARYSEYRSVSRVLTWLNGQLEIVPCSRSDVFANSKVSVIEKRMLMKLLTSLDDGNEELKSYENKTFRTFLKDKKLTTNLIHYVLYAISNSTDDTLCYQGVENTKRFLNSLGRFGKTPFLFCMYGSGEITQAFCRLSAVFGGVFALGQPVNGFIFKSNHFKALLVGEQRINAEHIVMSIEKSPDIFVSSFTKKYISRAVFITNRSIMDSEKEHLTLLLYPPENNKNSVTVIELGSLTGTCPKNLYLVHLISSQISAPQEDLKHVVENLFDVDSERDNNTSSDKPKMLWSCYFSLPDSNYCDLRENVPKNVYLCPGPDIDLDYDLSIIKAKEIFSDLYPDMEFLPRAPDPEEIVIEGEEDNGSDILKEKNEGDNIENTVVAELIHNIEKHNLDEAQSTENI